MPTLNLAVQYASTLAVLPSRNQFRQWAKAAIRVDTEVTIGEFVEIGAGAIINSEVFIGNGAFVGSGAVVVSGIKIGENARIGAGSVVVADVKENSTVFGNPAAVVGK